MKAFPSFRSGIPRPDLVSWMHERVEIKKETSQERNQRYARQPRYLKIVDSILSRIVKRLKLCKNAKIAYKIAMNLAHVYLKITHDLKIRGKENIPKSGSIMFLLHNGDKDVEYFISAFKEPVGIFTDVGNGFIADFLERCMGFVTRRGTRDQMVEKMIRTILFRNRYFAIWPEGSPARDGHPKEPFSGIVRVYATLNSKKNIIPFQPVLMRGTETYLYKGDKRFQKILVEFLKPFFIPRQWLQKPEDGGKTPRFIINKVMLALAKKIGYSTLKKNHALELRRRSGGNPWK
ncbi:MAG: hypothetical protein ACTSVI_03030 [Promethearchaeota archaeon]